MIPGEYRITAKEDLVINKGRDTVTLTVSNQGGRPIQVGSHIHFFEVNKQLGFDRLLAFGYRLNIPAGTAVRFEPGEEKPVELVRLGGKREVYGLNGLTNGSAADLPEDTAPLQRRVELWKEGDTA